MKYESFYLPSVFMRVFPAPWQRGSFITWKINKVYLRSTWHFTANHSKSNRPAHGTKRVKLRCRISQVYLSYKREGCARVRSTIVLFLGDKLFIVIMVEYMLEHIFVYDAYVFSVPVSMTCRPFTCKSGGRRANSRTVQCLRLVWYGLSLDVL